MNHGRGASLFTVKREFIIDLLFPLVNQCTVTYAKIPQYVLVFVFECTHIFQHFACNYVIMYLYGFPI